MICTLMATWILAAFILFQESASFVLTVKPWQLQGVGYNNQQHVILSSSQNNDDDGGGGGTSDGGTSGGGDFMDAMRRMLEASWDAETMGDVPRDPNSAAEAAVVALQQAIRDEDADAAVGVAYLIDLQFPPYDISQGENMYDEVAAVEFCMELARRISKNNSSSGIGDSKSLILVKDEKAVQTVNRVLSARERTTAVIIDDDEDEGDEEEDEGDEEEDEENDDDEDDGQGTNVDFYDDFADFGSIGASDDNSVYDDFADFGTIGSNKESRSSPSSPPPPPPETAGGSNVISSDIDSFRQKLMSTWDDESSTSTTSVPAAEATKRPKPKKEKPKKAKREPKQTLVTSDAKKSLESSSSFRLSSIFGSATISRGADMGGDVLQAVKENVQPSEKEQTLIVLSANQREDVMAIRTILQKTKKAALLDDIQRRVILVNFGRLDPLPRELTGAKTVYSILPLVAKQSVSTTNPFQQKQQDLAAGEKPIKVVVMRRYPRDWQVFVDDGSTGTFELASSAPARGTETRGPPMQWVSNCIKKFLESRIG